MICASPHSLTVNVNAIRATAALMLLSSVGAAAAIAATWTLLGREPLIQLAPLVEMSKSPAGHVQHAVQFCVGLSCSGFVIPPAKITATTTLAAPTATGRLCAH